MWRCLKMSLAWPVFHESLWPNLSAKYIALCANTTIYLLSFECATMESCNLCINYSRLTSTTATSCFRPQMTDSESNVDKISCPVFEYFLYSDWTIQTQISLKIILCNYMLCASHTHQDRLKAWILTRPFDAACHVKLWSLNLYVMHCSEVCFWCSVIGQKAFLYEMFFNFLNQLLNILDKCTQPAPGSLSWRMGLAWCINVREHTGGAKSGLTFNRFLWKRRQWLPGLVNPIRRFTLLPHLVFFLFLRCFAAATCVLNPVHTQTQLLVLRDV